MKHYFSLAVLFAAAIVTSTQPADACTGITLTVKDQSKVVARTIEWGGTDLNSQYVIVPRGYTAHTLRNRDSQTYRQRKKRQRNSGSPFFKCTHHHDP